jgi:WD40 repeat protein
LTISPDGATILTRAEDGVIRFWEVTTGRLLDARADHDGGLGKLALSSDGQTLLTAARGDRSARVWNVGRARPRPVSSSVEESSNPYQPFYCLVYNLDRDRVVTGGRDGLAQLWEASTGRPIQPLRHPHPHVRAVAFSPDGRKLATACMEGRTVTCKVRIWNAATGQPITPWIPHRNHVVALAFSPDGKLLATGDYSHDLHLWDTATGEHVGEPLRQRDIVLSLAFDPDGKTTVAGTAMDWNRDPQARLWDVTSRNPIGEPLRHTGYVVYVTFSPDGKTVVTGSQDSTFRLWDAATGQPRSDSRTVTKGWRCAAISPAGKSGEVILATAGGDGSVRLWSLIDASPLKGATLPHPREVPAVAVAFSPDGTLLAVGHEDGTAQLWDLATRLPLGPPVVQFGKLLGVAFSPDGQKILTTAADGATRIWPTPTYERQVANLSDSNPSDLEKLSLWLQVRTGLRMDESQALTRITGDDWRLRHEQFAEETRETSDRSRSPSATFAWHDDRARDAEQTGQTFTARWHLDRLIGLRQTDWLLYARRARTLTSDGRWDRAKKDYQRALELGCRDDLLAWYHFRMSACQWRQQSSAAQWYLHRILQLCRPPVGFIHF